MNKNWKITAWKYATAIVVAIIIFNPEVAEIALFIDAVGLEMFFMLIEVQIILTIGIFYEKFKLTINYFKRLTLSAIYFREEPKTIILLVPSQSTLMQLLVVSFFVSLLFKIT